MFHDRIHNSPPLIHIARQMNLVYALPVYVLQILINITLPSTIRS